MPGGRILRAGGVREGCVRREPCTILERVVALDEGDLLGGLVREVVPLMVGVVADGEGACADDLVSTRLWTQPHTLTSSSVGVDEAYGHEVVLRVEVAPVRHRERPVVDGVRDRSPEVDQPDAGLEEAGGVGAEELVDTLDGRFVSLVDVDAFLAGTN